MGIDNGPRVSTRCSCSTRHRRSSKWCICTTLCACRPFTALVNKRLIHLFGISPLPELPYQAEQLQHSDTRRARQPPQRPPLPGKRRQLLATRVVTSKDPGNEPSLGSRLGQIAACEVRRSLVRFVLRPLSATTPCAPYQARGRLVGSSWPSKTPIGSKVISSRLLIRSFRQNSSPSEDGRECGGASAERESALA